MISRNTPKNNSKNKPKTMLTRALLVLLLIVLSRPGLTDDVLAEVLVARDLYLYVPQSDNRRLLLEPGAILLEKHIPQSEVFKKRIRVISLGGVEGEIRASRVDRLSALTGRLAYVKNEIDIKGNKYPGGTILPVEVLDEDGETVYKVTYPKPYYSVKQNRFLLKKKSQTFQENEFTSMFNLIDPDVVSQHKFPVWVRSTQHEPTEWGCNESTEVSTTLGASVGAGAEVSGGFFGFFQAKAGTSGEASTTTVYKRMLKDLQYRHRITYWDLFESQNRTSQLISVALEKISVCDTNKGVNNSYINCRSSDLS
ncbi:MAG: hypothetical protein GKR96_07870 [Gammaproteobacteria bacterium]|nr:hypothetical protein [Gammaproteobacteria bacterium]